MAEAWVPRATLLTTLIYILPTSITGFAYGWEVGSMGGILGMPQFLEYMGTPSSFRQGLMTAALIAGEIVGSLFVGFLFADRYGRRVTIILSIAIYCVGQIIVVAAQNQGMFIAGRVINGLGAGPWFQMMSVYTAEITPHQIRGRCTSSLNSGIAVGILVAYWVQYGVLHIAADGAWRISFAMQLIPGFIVAAYMWRRPESPRWLIKHNRSSEALKILARLHASGNVNDPAVQLEMLEIQASTEIEGSEKAPSYLELITAKAYRRRTALAMGLQCMQQLSGANIVLYYAAKVFAQTGKTGPSAALLANGISSSILLVGTLMLTLSMDHIGRRLPIYLGPFCMGSCLIVVGTMLVKFGSPHFDQTTQAVQFTFRDVSAGNAAIAFMFLFQFFFGLLSSGIPWTYQTEMFPVAARARGSSLAVTANYFTNFWLGLYIPEALNSASWKLYYIFGGINLGASLIDFLFYPETAGKTLEQLDLLFLDGRTVWVFKDREACKTAALNQAGVEHAHEAFEKAIVEKAVAEGTELSAVRSVNLRAVGEKVEIVHRECV